MKPERVCSYMTNRTLPLRDMRECIAMARDRADQGMCRRRATHEWPPPPATYIFDLPPLHGPYTTTTAEYLDLCNKVFADLGKRICCDFAWYEALHYELEWQMAPVRLKLEVLPVTSFCRWMCSEACIALVGCAPLPHKDLNVLLAKTLWEMRGDRKWDREIK